jgi:hypothetical protein
MCLQRSCSGTTTRRQRGWNVAQRGKRPKLAQHCPQRGGQRGGTTWRSNRDSVTVHKAGELNILNTHCKRSWPEANKDNMLVKDYLYFDDWRTMAEALCMNSLVHVQLKADLKVFQCAIKYSIVVKPLVSQVTNPDS